MIITEENIELLARKVIEIIEEKNKNEAFVILLEGDLGAGKTTFVKSFGKCLSIEEDILSPTFILKKGYDAVHHKIKKIIHVDAYRFNEKEEAKMLRLEEDAKIKGNIILIEWPSKMYYIKPDLTLSFEVIDENTREVKVQPEADQPLAESRI